MEQYQRDFSEFLAENKILFFGNDLTLKDGRPTPYFVNMGKCKTGDLLVELGEFYAGGVNSNFSANINTIFGPSYKGSMIAVATVMGLSTKHGRNLQVEYDRKEAKTHGDAGNKQKLMVTGSIDDYARIAVVDDVATSMATKYEALRKIDMEVKERELSQVHVSGFLVGVNREQTTAVYKTPGDNSTVVLGAKGKDAIREFMDATGKPVYSIANITEIVNYLFNERVPVQQNRTKEPISNQTMDVFREYMETYGVK
jgi:orotate phosphoribosyltransferase